mmetsp:Transcript_17455/g.57721  ORF Transcript_17455/g.57721 Transcript_17455/m.57721 type:complete len:95 (-) Transcript_17455:1026-1310(-)
MPPQDEDVKSFKRMIRELDGMLAGRSARFLPSLPFFSEPEIRLSSSCPSVFSLPAIDCNIGCSAMSTLEAELNSYKVEEEYCLPPAVRCSHLLP